MSVVNLTSARKAKARADARVKAGLNAAKHGQTKAERALQKTLAEKMSRALDAHRRETD